MSEKKKPTMPRAPMKLACVEDVSRYLTTVTKMLHNDLITPTKANALKSLCLAKIDSLKKNKEVQQAIQINIGCRMGRGKTKKIASVQATEATPLIEINQQAPPAPPALIEQHPERGQIDAQTVLNEIEGQHAQEQEKELVLLENDEQEQLEELTIDIEAMLRDLENE